MLTRKLEKISKETESSKFGESRAVQIFSRQISWVKVGQQISTWYLWHLVSQRCVALQVKAYWLPSSNLKFIILPYWRTLFTFLKCGSTVCPFCACLKDNVFRQPKILCTITLRSYNQKKGTQKFNNKWDLWLYSRGECCLFDW